MLKAKGRADFLIKTREIRLYEPGSFSESRTRILEDPNQEAISQEILERGVGPWDPRTPWGVLGVIIIAIIILVIIITIITMIMLIIMVIIMMILYFP